MQTNCLVPPCHQRPSFLVDDVLDSNCSHRGRDVWSINLFGFLLALATFVRLVLSPALVMLAPGPLGAFKGFGSLLSWLGSSLAP